MGKARKHTPEQIVNILRQIEVAMSNGKTTPSALPKNGWSNRLRLASQPKMCPLDPEWTQIWRHRP
jgi:hypothetical protein